MQVDIGQLKSIGKTWTCAGRSQAAHDSTILQSRLLEDKQLLGIDDFTTLHAQYFGNTGDLAAAVAHALLVYDQVNRAADLLAYRFQRDLYLTHGNQSFQTTESVTRAIGVYGGH